MTQLSYLLIAALRIIGISQGSLRQPNNAQLLESLAVFNRMVGSWNAIKLNIFALLISQYTFAANQQTYTFGPGGSGPYWLSPARPAKIERANLIITSNPTPVRRPIDLLEPDDWAAKRVLVIPGPPLQLYDDYASPVSTLYAWPVPDQNYPFELYTWSQVPTATTITNAVQLPPGYEEAIVYNLAKRLVGTFKSEGAAITPGDLEIARQSLSAIQSRNTRSPRLVNDAARLGSRTGLRGDFDYYTGEPT